MNSPSSHLRPNSHVGRAWHIFRKDARLLWSQALALCLVHIAVEVLYLLNPDGSKVVLKVAGALLEVARVVGFGALLVILVQQDVLPGDRQDWLLRPIRRGELLLAKLLFVFLLLILPLFVVDLATGLAGGFSFLPSGNTAIWMSISRVLMFALPILAVAAATRSLDQAILVGVGGIIAITLILVGLALATGFDQVTFGGGGSGSGWAKALTQLLVSDVGAGAALLLQYFRRNSLPSILLQFGVGLLAVSTAFVPETPFAAVEHRLSPEPDADETIKLALAEAPVHGMDSAAPAPGFVAKGEWSPLLPGGPDEDIASQKDGVLISIPLSVAGLATDALLRSANVSLRLLDARGKRLFIVHTASFAAGEPLLVATGHAAAMRFFVPGSIFNGNADQVLHLVADASLTLLKPSPRQVLPIDAVPQFLPELGKCAAQVTASGNDLSLTCLSVQRLAPCVGLTPAHGSERIACTNESALPLNLNATPWSRGTLNLAGAANGAPTLTAYRPVTRFRRHLEADLRLIDYRVEPPPAAPH